MDVIIMVAIVLCSLCVVFLRTTTRVARFNKSGRPKTKAALIKMYFLSALEGLATLIVASVLYFYISSKF